MSLGPSKDNLTESIQQHHKRLIQIISDLEQRGLKPADKNLFKDDNGRDFTLSIETLKNASKNQRLTVRVKREDSAEEVYTIAYKEGESAFIQKKGLTLSFHDRRKAESELHKVLLDIEDDLDGRLSIKGEGSDLGTTSASVVAAKVKLPAIPVSEDLKQTTGIIRLFDQVAEVIHKNRGAQGFGQFGEGEAYVYSGHRLTPHEGGMAAKTDLDLVSTPFNFIIAKSYIEDSDCIRVLIVNPGRDEKVTFLIDPKKDMPEALKIFSEERLKGENFIESSTSASNRIGTFLKEDDGVSTEDFYQYLARMQAGFNALLKVKPD